MKPREFYELVKKMRESQRDYFRTRLTDHLKQSKYLEQQVDREIERVENILHPKPTQQKLEL